MSRSRQKRKQAKHQRAKLLLLPLLLAVLGYVLWPSGAGEEDTAAAAIAPGANSVQATAGQRGGSAPPPAPLAGKLLASATPGAVNDGTSLANKSQLPVAWPRVELSQLGKQSPFAAAPVPKPAPADEESSAESQATSQLAEAGEAEIEAKPTAPALDLAELSKKPVHYYFQSNNRRVMLVGEHLLSQGQKLDTYTVKQLEPTRILLEPQGDVAEPATSLVPVQN